MGKIVVTEFVSLDGVFEAPGGGEDFKHAGWTFTFDRGEDGNKFKLEELMAADAQLLGRVTYEGFAAAWPQMEEQTGEFGKRMNAMPKFVVSTTLTEATATWNNTTIISSDIVNQVEALKKDHAGDILIAGSGQLVGTLMEHDLSDEYRLMVFPIVLGSGRRLFGDNAPLTRLTLTDAKQLGPDGVQLLTYAPDRHSIATQQPGG